LFLELKDSKYIETFFKAFSKLGVQKLTRYKHYFTALKKIKLVISEA